MSESSYKQMEEKVKKKCGALRVLKVMAVLDVGVV
jgi:CO/xanthine dehydrogenase Mo-binding subunit